MFRLHFTVEDENDDACAAEERVDAAFPEPVTYALGELNHAQTFPVRPH